MLNEMEKRRPEFAPESNPVVLDDGQTWYLPKPMVSLRPQFSGGKSAGLAAMTTLGDEFDSLIKAIDDGNEFNRAIEAGEIDAEPYDLATNINDVLNVGAFLLLRNYDLTDAELISLFAWRGGKDLGTSNAMATAILDTARGRAPKAYGDGDGSP